MGGKAAVPLGQAALSEAGDDDGVEGLLGAGDGDAQRAAVALQLHCVDDGPRGLLLVCNTGQQHTGVHINTVCTQDTSQRGREQNGDSPHNTGQRERARGEGHGSEEKGGVDGRDAPIWLYRPNIIGLNEFYSPCSWISSETECDTCVLHKHVRRWYL